jgi:hypothetical protein
MPKAYGIRFEGRLTEQDRAAFTGMQIVDVPAGTLIYGEVMDECHLQGILAQLRILGLAVTSVYPVRP